MTVRILTGDCRDLLPTLDAESVQCVVTSPPYFGLRDYGVADQIGLEPSPREYVEQMVAVFREVRRVLRDDGTLWLNLGDSFANDGKWGGHTGGKHAAALHCSPIGRNKRYTGLKPKDLCLIPWRVGLALQDDGWWLRSDIIWSKPNPMPESVRDRPTRSHEYLLLLTKSERYYYDAAAIAEPAVRADEAKWDPGTDGLSGGDRNTGKSTRRFGKSGNKARRLSEDAVGRNGHGAPDVRSVPWEGLTRNRRSVWTVPSQPYRGAHFATFPPALIEPCILAGSRPGDVVLDPFGGAGTTGLVADRLGRDALLIELNVDYAELARQRITGDAPLFSEVAHG